MTTTTLTTPVVLTPVPAGPRQDALPRWRRWVERLRQRLARSAKPPRLRLVHAPPAPTLSSEDALDWAMSAGAEGGMLRPDLWSDPRYAHEVARRHRETMM